ncbi:chromosome partitioning protein ParA [Salipiger aestuarii]|uniref:Chromosome partitioning protein n=1 Tax=Salipiger aestuarii TaxID=568098 RepID=A0A327Y566_9RHOB|nr:plasmid partitioning protein RepA [Salipiger aestuarii]EIE50945.1 RepA partitioning protein/ATPase, ParA type [Citreicella sp. 357]KAA8607741.1 chromosome partitioning protein ParA [Salipiger aestuarii]KAA8609412.1 chromosome partitioning protein ParA [Salipiger aestuarii]KAB2542007.1 chromosome partitioning protein ParA [Salipiger aestuarii]RAK15597.1 chromosome partitioning protein [Salipiger aestuarii]
MQDTPPREDLNSVIRAHSEWLAAQLHAQAESMFPPDASKQMRKFTSGEAASLLGVNDSYLRKLHLDGKGPSPELTPGNRRLYSVQDIADLRTLLEKTARKPGDYLPGRRVAPDGGHTDPMQIIGVMNFKGGSGKTTSSAHLAQRLALLGYRVLAIDLDPQASLTALHGVQPEYDLAGGGTLYDAIRYDDPVPIADVIRRTYIPGLDLIPGNLELMEFEHDTPRALAQGNAGLFFFRVREALAQVDSDYDVVVIDCPPQLGFLTMSALSAATGVLVTIHPEMLDVMSMSQFLRMTADLMDVIADSGADMKHDWMRYLLTRYEPTDAPQTRIVAFLRTMYGDKVLNAPMLKSTAISDAGLTKQTLYEVDRSAFTRTTYDRAIESLNAVNDEIADLIQQTWGRK